ncbi:hypothetical protein [Clostridium sp.]|uniref:hypothetical protein n=1 Tax=Clostridium sp. TaxID=1506 RepID=UPI002630111E|nr:hypothetical protein [Clostridium sp.]
MKKVSIVLLTITIIFSLVSCGNRSTKTNSGQVEEKTSQSDKDKEKAKEEVKTVTIGSTISGKSADITVNKIEFSYDVLPDKTDGFYNHYPAEQGKVYINIDVDVKNTQKQELRCGKVMKVEANYNDGYKYNSQAIVEDKNLGFTYANITSITPLETKGMRLIIDCPQEVEKSANTLTLTFDIDGEKYNYTMR